MTTSLRRPDRPGPKPPGNSSPPGLAVEVIGWCATVVDATARRLGSSVASLSCSIAADHGLAHRYPGSCQPDVVAVACGSAPLESPALIRSLGAAAGAVPVVVLSDVEDELALLTVLRCGASGFLLTTSTAEELGADLRRAAGGQIIVDRAIAGRIIRQMACGTWRGATRDDDWNLTPRERQVLDSLVEGRSNRQIARDLNLGQETVKTYLGGIYRKLGVRDRTQAVAVTLGRQWRSADRAATATLASFADQGLARLSGG